MIGGQFQHPLTEPGELDGILFYMKRDVMLLCSLFPAQRKCLEDSCH